MMTKTMTAELPGGTLVPPQDPGFQHPTCFDVRALKEISGMTGKELCELVGVTDARTWRRWSQEPGTSGARKIPYSAWRILVVDLGLVEGFPGQPGLVLKTQVHFHLKKKMNESLIRSVEQAQTLKLARQTWKDLPIASDESGKVLQMVEDTRTEQKEENGRQTELEELLAWVKTR